MDQKIGQQFSSFHLLKINLLFLTATRVRTDKGDKKFAKADSRCCRKSKETQEESDEGYTRGALFKSAPSFSLFPLALLSFFPTPSSNILVSRTLRFRRFKPLVRTEFQQLIGKALARAGIAPRCHFLLEIRVGEKIEEVERARAAWELAESVLQYR